MAELVLKVNSKAGSESFKDGDILHCWTNRRIKCIHAEVICNVMKFGFTGDGRRPESLARKFRQHTFQYRMDRVNRTEVLRTNLITLAQDTISNVPNGNGEYIHVQAFLDRQLAYNRHTIFGPIGSEFWFGGRKDFGHTKLDLVWNDIETDTPEREVDHRFHPLGLQDEFHVCLLKCDDPLTENDAANLEEPEIEVRLDSVTNIMTEHINKKRRRFVDYKALPNSILTNKDQSDIQDPGKSGDKRNNNKSVDLNTFVVVKALRPT